MDQTAAVRVIPHSARVMHSGHVVPVGLPSEAWSSVIGAIKKSDLESYEICNHPQMVYSAYSNAQLRFILR